MRKLVQELLEKEVGEYLGRAYYEHGETKRGYSYECIRIVMAISRHMRMHSYESEDG